MRCFGALAESAIPSCAGLRNLADQIQGKGPRSVTCLAVGTDLERSPRGRVFFQE
jgi:hypothetical protein